MTRALLFSLAAVLVACDTVPLALRDSGAAVATADTQLSARDAGLVLDGGRESQTTPDAADSVDTVSPEAMPAPGASGCGVGYHVDTEYPSAIGAYCAPDTPDAGPPRENPCAPGAWVVTWYGQGIVKCSAVDGGGS